MGPPVWFVSGELCLLLGLLLSVSGWACVGIGEGCESVWPRLAGVRQCLSCKPFIGYNREDLEQNSYNPS